MGGGVIKVLKSDTYYLNDPYVFLSQYCVSKIIAWRRPYTEFKDIDLACRFPFPKFSISKKCLFFIVNANSTYESDLSAERDQLLNCCVFLLGVNFTNILCAAFTRKDTKSAKKQLELTVFFVLLGSAHVKAGCRMLVKLTPGCRSTFTWTSSGANFTIILRADFVPVD